MYGTVKCLPTSRRNSIRVNAPSQSRLLTISAPPSPARKSRNRSSCDADRAYVCFERLAVEEVPLAGPTRRIADHPGPAADHRDGPAAEPLQPEQPEDRHEMSDVERGCGGVEPDVAGDRPTAREAIREPRRGRVEDAAPLELREQRGQPRAGRDGLSRHRQDVWVVSTPEDQTGLPTTLCYRPDRRCKQASRGANGIAERSTGAPRPLVDRKRSAASSSRSPSSSSPWRSLPGSLAWSSPWACTTSTPPACPTPRRSSTSSTSTSPRSSMTGRARSSSLDWVLSAARSSGSTTSRARCSMRRPRSRTRSSGRTRASTPSASCRPVSTPFRDVHAAPRRSPSSSSAIACSPTGHSRARRTNASCARSSSPPSSPMPIPARKARRRSSPRT